MTKDPFTQDERLALYEIARRALADADLFDDMADHLDLADAEMQHLLLKLQTWLDEGKTIPDRFRMDLINQ